MIYHDVVADHEVWVLVEQPYVPNPDGAGYVQAQHFLVAFKFDQPPGVIVGEYLRSPDGGFLKCDTADQAADAAFAEARRRVEAERS